MKLRIFKHLMAAVLPCLFAYSASMYAATEYGGVTYSGNIFNIAASESGTFHDRNFTNYYKDGDGWKNSEAWAGTGRTYYLGTEQVNAGRAFWEYAFSVYGSDIITGSTLRLTGGTSDVYLENTFYRLALGGLIVEEGGGSYTLGRPEKGSIIRIRAEAGESANFLIKTNTNLSSGTKAGEDYFSVESGGTWDVAEGKTLTFARFTDKNDIEVKAASTSMTLSGGVAVDITGGGTVDIQTSQLTVGGDAGFSVEKESTLKLKGSLDIGGQVTVSGGSEVQIEIAASTGGASASSICIKNLEGTGKGTVENIASSLSDGVRSLSARRNEAGDVLGTARMESLSVKFESALAVSDLTLEDVCFAAAPGTAGSVTMTYANTTALARLTNPMGAELQSRSVSALAEDLGNAATADATLTTVQTGGSAAGGLVIDLSSSFFAYGADNSPGPTLEWTVFDGVALADGFTLSFGDVLQSFVREGKVTLSGSLVDPVLSGRVLTVDDVTNPMGVGTSGLVGGAAGSLVLTVRNVPEPAAATLSLLALAALATRRRRKSA